MVKVWLGIDLGTTDSEAAIFLPETENVKAVLSDNPEIKYEEDGKYIVPSAVSYNVYGEVIAVGALAKRNAVIEPRRTVLCVKRLIGKSYEEGIKEKEKKLALPYKIIKGAGDKALIKIDNREIAPEEVTAEILRRIRDNARKFVRNTLQEEMELEKVYITVPAYFDLHEKNATKEAARIAGFGVDDPEKFRLIVEPLAALYCYMDQGKISKKDRNIIVFDIGAGTLDIIIVGNYPEEGDCIVNEITGNTELGGADMDSEILNWIKREVEVDLSKEGVEWDDLLNKGLREHVEETKILLSEKTRAYIMIPNYKSIELTREKLNELVRPIVEKCRKKIREGLETAKLSKEDIHKIILVGGPTKMPVIQEMIREEVGEDKILAEISPMLCVAIGAARGPRGGIPPSRPCGLYWNNIYVEVVKKSTQLPTENSEFFDLRAPEFEVHSVQRREEHDEECGMGKKAYRSLGKFKFLWPELGKIDITFKIDERENLSVIVKYGEHQADLNLFNEFEIVCIEDNGDDKVLVYITECLAKEALSALLRLMEAALLCEYFGKLPLGMIEGECREEVRGKIVDLKGIADTISTYIFTNIIQEFNLTPELINRIRRNLEPEKDEQIRKRVEELGKIVMKSGELRELGIRIEDVKKLRERCVNVTPELVKEWVERGRCVFDIVIVKLQDMQEEQKRITKEKILKLEGKMREIGDEWERILADSKVRKKAFFRLQDLEAEVMAAAGIQEEEVSKRMRYRGLC